MVAQRRASRITQGFSKGQKTLKSTLHSRCIEHKPFLDFAPIFSFEGHVIVVVVSSMIYDRKAYRDLKFIYTSGTIQL